MVAKTKSGEENTRRELFWQKFYLVKNEFEIRFRFKLILYIFAFVDILEMQFCFCLAKENRTSSGLFLHKMKTINLHLIVSVFVFDDEAFNQN